MWPLGALLLVAGAALRLWHVFAEPLWLDEAYSAFAADHDLGFLWRIVPRYETHPPFYYSLLHAWAGLAGDSVTALRLPGVIAGLLTLPLIALIAIETGRSLDWSPVRRRWLALAAFALACLVTGLIEMSRQVRPYPLMILVYAVAALALVRLHARSRAGQPVGSAALAAHFVLVELMLWLHNMGPLYAVAMTLGLGAAVLRPGLSRRDWAWLVVGHLAVALAYLPGFAILLGQTPTWVSSTWVRFRPPEVVDRLRLLYGAEGLATFAAIGLVAMAVAAGRRSPQGNRPIAILLLLAIVPVLLSVLISVSVAPVFITRTMTPVAVPAILLYALGGTAWDGWRRSLGLGAIILLGFSAGVVDLQQRMAGPMEHWYGTVDWLRARFRPGDQIFAYPNEGALPLGFALRDRGLAYPIRSIPGPVPTFAEPGAWYPTGSRGVVSLTPARLQGIADEPRTRAVPTVWLLRLGKAQYDRGDVFLRALHRGRYVVRSWRAGAIEIVGLRRLPRGFRPQAAAPPPPQP